MRTIHLLLVLLAVVMISFGSCRNKAAKNRIAEYAEESFNDSLPDELKNFVSIEFISQDDSTERITLFLKNPKKINQAYPPVLEFPDEKWERINFSQVNMIGNDSDIAFSDNAGNERAILRMNENIPTGFLLVTTGKDKFYSVANCIIFGISENDENTSDENILEEVLTDIKKISSQTYNIPQAIKDIVSSSRELYFCAMGDLNGDPYDDAILIVKGEHRECWILTGTSDSLFEINAVKNIDPVWWGGHYGDDHAFEHTLFDIVIGSGYFSIERNGGLFDDNEWIYLYHFKYSKKDNKWQLFQNDILRSRFAIDNCCDYYLSMYYVEKIFFEDSFDKLEKLWQHFN
jgi:hypothetical protein